MTTFQISLERKDFKKVGFGVRVEGSLWQKERVGDKGPEVSLSVLKETRSSAEVHALGYECMKACVKDALNISCANITHI